MSAAIELSISPRERSLGDFTVRRALPDARRKLVGPFIFFDHMGPASFEVGQGMEVRAHPHIGLATITYLFEGRIRHRDSLGYDQEITPGAVNWMTAGRGIVHSERTPADLRRSGSRLHGIQSWVALPLGSEECAPAFDHYPAADIPTVDVDGVGVRVIMGRAFGVHSPVRTASETLYGELCWSRDGRIELDATGTEQALYVVDGPLAIDGDAVASGTLVVLRRGARPELGGAADARAMLLGGEPLEGSRNIWWNFVSSSKQRIEQARADWRDGRFGAIPGETEFIPLPEH